MTDIFGSEILTTCQKCCSLQKKKKKKIKRQKNKNVSTQTGEISEQLAKDVTSLSSLPIEQTLELPLSNSVDSQVECNVVSPKVEWMFDPEYSCARCKGIRPQIRLLRALKKSMAERGILKLGEHAVMKKSGVVPLDTMWNALGVGLQTVFMRLSKLCQILDNLPLNVVLKQSSFSLFESLKHLLTHIPLPSSVLERFSSFPCFLSPLFSVHIFGFKLREVIRLLRFLHTSKNTSFFPSFFRAEVAEVERKAYRLLVLVAQDICRKSDDSSYNPHSQCNMKGVASSSQLFVSDSDSCLDSCNDSDSKFNHDASKKINHDLEAKIWDLCRKKTLKRVKSSSITQTKMLQSTQNTAVTECCSNSEDSIRKAGKKSCASAKISLIDSTASSSCAQFTGPTSSQSFRPLTCKIFNGTVLVDPLPALPLPSLLPLRNSKPALPLQNPLLALPLPNPLPALPLTVMCSTSKLKTTCTTKAAADNNRACFSTTGESVSDEMVARRTRTVIVSPITSVGFSTATPLKFQSASATGISNQSVSLVNSNMSQAILPYSAFQGNISQHAVPSVFHSAESIVPVIPFNASVWQPNAPFALYDSLRSCVNMALLSTLISRTKNDLSISTTSPAVSTLPVLLPKLPVISLSAINTAALPTWTNCITTAVSRTTEVASTYFSLPERYTPAKKPTSPLVYPNSIPMHSASVSGTLPTSTSEECDYTLKTGLEYPNKDRSCHTNTSDHVILDAADLKATKNVMCATTTTLDKESCCVAFASIPTSTSCDTSQSSVVECLPSVSDCQEMGESMEHDFPITMSMQSPSSNNEFDDCTPHNLALTDGNYLVPPNSSCNSNTNSDKCIPFSPACEFASLTKDKVVGTDMDNDVLTDAQPTILKVVKSRDSVMIRWLFPVDLHEHVQQYMIYIVGVDLSKGDKKSWTKLGRVKPCPLPMTLTLTRVAHVDKFSVSIKALYLDGQYSKLSNPLVI